MRTRIRPTRHSWMLGLLAALLLTGLVACKSSEAPEEAPAEPPKAAEGAKSGKAAKGDAGDKAVKGAKKDAPAKAGDEAKGGKTDKAAKPGGVAVAAKGADPIKGAAKAAGAGDAARGPAEKAIDRAAADDEPPAIPVTDSSAGAIRGGVKGLVVDPGPMPAEARGAGTVDRGAAPGVAPPARATAPMVAEAARGAAPPVAARGSADAVRGAATPTAERLGEPERLAPPSRAVEAPAPSAERGARGAASQQAGREPAGASPRVAPARPVGPALDVSQAMTASELKVIAGGKTFKQGTLAGREGDPSYNSLYFAPTKGGAYGVAIQVWYEPTIRDTRTRYEDMKLTYPNVQETGNVTNYTYFAFWNDIYYLVFMGLKQRLVISVTASSETLSPNQLFAVATKVRDRLIH